MKTLPGFREFTPQDCAVRNAVFTSWKRVSNAFGFLEYDAPVLEPLELFTQKSGDEIVKQLFCFEDQGERKVTLRAEMTPALARMVGSRANALGKPIKWFNVGEHYRYERPQKGRLRAFYQLNCDILGEPSPIADAECIALLIEQFKAFGLTDEHFYIRLSDRTLWTLLLEHKYSLKEDALTQALSAIDKLEKLKDEDLLKQLAEVVGERAQELAEDIAQFAQLNSLPAIREHLSDLPQEALGPRLEELEVLLDTLKALGYSDFVKIDLSIVRGLAYYTGFVFEAFQAVGKGRALAGGGRYDHLVKKLMGTDLPAVGFAIGDVTLGDLLSEVGLTPETAERSGVYVAFNDESVRSYALEVVGKLRSAGIAVEYGFAPRNLGKSIKQANGLNKESILLLGEDERDSRTVAYKHLESGKSATVEFSELAGIAHFGV